jgi:intein-encoded DNA endonuclease-like protein
MKYKQTISIHQAKEKGSVVNNKQEDWMFKFDHVLHVRPS